jgi:vacuolar protein sorting-associated protein 35
MNDKTENQLINSIYALIKKSTKLLKISIEKNSMRQVLINSNEILCQLKTDLLTPHSYHQLFTLIYDQISLIQSYFRSEYQKGRNMLDLYSSVQQCNTALPRAYLMIIAGNILLEKNICDKKIILEDLLDACNNIKHPIRGLFLRYFMLKILNDYFTDIDLLIINFKEMNKLWINVKKLKNISANNIKKYRNDLKVLIGENITKLANNFNNKNTDENNINNENKNIMLDKEIIYKEKILIPILNIIKECKDAESQEFILICIIQVFNEEYNIKNIYSIINALIDIKENINLKLILGDIMEKLSKFKEIEKIKEIKMKDIFQKINECIISSMNKKLEKINELKNNNEKIFIDINDKELISLIELQHSYIKFILNFSSSNSKKDILNILINNLNKSYELLNSIKSHNKEISRISITNYALTNENMIIIYDYLNELVKSPLLIVEFENFPYLMNFLNNTFFYELSLTIFDNLLNTFNLGSINNLDICKKLMKFMEPIININHSNLREYLSNKLIYITSKIVFVPRAKDPYEQLEMLQLIKNNLIDSTKNDNEILTEKKKLVYLTNCLNALFLLGLNINESYENIIKNKNNNLKKNQIHLDFCNNYNFNNKKFNIKKEESFLSFYELLFKEIDTIFEHIKNISAKCSLKLYIECSIMINNLKFQDIDKYEDYAFFYMNKALEILKGENSKKEENNNDIIIEENIKYEYIIYLIGAVSKMDIFTDQHYNTIRENIEKIIEGLSKRNEQCILMLKCINLYCNEMEIDTNKIIDLFAKAKKYAIYSMINPENTILFVYILNEYLRLDGFIKDFDKTVKIEDFKEIIETIENYLTNMKNENKYEKIIKNIENYYNATIENIKLRKKEKSGKKYRLISNLNIDK